MLKLDTQSTRVIQVENLSLYELEHMILHSAITRTRGANRRYHHWFFVYDSESQTLTKMFQHVPSMDEVLEWKTHLSCHGDGCKSCFWSGETPK